MGGSTLGHVGHLVLAHRLEGLPLELALGLRVDSEEVEIGTRKGKDAGEDGEDLDGSHVADRCGVLCARLWRVRSV
jgi:hypothetical protein